VLHSGEGPDVPLCIALAAVLALFSPTGANRGDGTCDWVLSWRHQQQQQQQSQQQEPSPQQQQQQQQEPSLVTLPVSAVGLTPEHQRQSQQSQLGTQQQQDEQGAEQALCRPAAWDLGKNDVRRALAYVSSWCPEARPTARMIKQVSLALQIGGPPPAHCRPSPNGNLKHKVPMSDKASH